MVRFTTIASCIAVSICGLVNGSRDEEMRPLLHFTPLDLYMNQPAAVHRFGSDLHVYYVKGSKNEQTNTAFRDWGHISTSDYSTFTEHPNGFLDLASDPATSIETGSFLPASTLVKDKHVLFYESVNATDNIAIRSRLVTNPDAAEPINNKPVGGLSQSNMAPLLWPSAFTFNNVSYIAHLSAVNGEVIFKKVTATADKIEMTAAGKVVTGMTVFCRSLQVFPLNSASSSKFVILLSYYNASDLLYYPSYWVGTFTGTADALTFTPDGGSMESAFRSMDSGHDAADWKVESFIDNGSTVALGVAVASNLYASTTIPTSPWRNGLALIRRLELQADNTVRQSYSLPAGLMMGMKELIKADTVLADTCAASQFTFSFGDAGEKGAYELMVTFDPAYITNGGVIVELSNSKDAAKKMLLQLMPDASQNVDLAIARTGLVPTGFSPLRNDKLPRPTTFNGKMNIVVDRTSVEFFMEDGAFVVSENYFTVGQFDTICLKKVAAAQANVTVKSLHSHKYKSIYGTSAAAASSAIGVALLAAVVALISY